MPRSVDSPRPVRLRSIQKLFGTAIFRPLTPGYRTQRTWIDGRPTAEVADTVIRPSDRLSSLERLEIYNRQYWFRLIDCVHDDFPGLRAILGKARFQHVIRAYLAECPSKSFTLRNIGEALTGFLRKYPEMTAPHTASALDMTRLEWAQIEAFDGTALAPLSITDIQATPPEKLRLSLQPHMQLLEVSYGVDDYLLDVKEICARAEASDIPNIRRRPRREHACVLIHRHNNSVYFKRLDCAAYYLLSALSRGETLTQAVTTAFETAPADSRPTPEAIRQWFVDWTSFGWFCKPI